MRPGGEIVRLDMLNLKYSLNIDEGKGQSSDWMKNNTSKGASELIL